MRILSRRTQILLEEEQYERLRRRGEETGASVGALIREAIDQSFPAVPDERRRAAAAFLRAVRSRPTEGEQEDWEVLKRRVRDEMSDAARHSG